MHNPWKTLSSRTVYQNRWITVREDQVITPAGTAGIYGVVQAAHATGIVALTSNAEVYLVGQYRYSMEEYSWEIVKGGANPGESPLEAAKRELREEIGMSAASFEPLGAEVHLSNCFTNERAYFFLARELSNVGAAPEETEKLEIRTLKLEKCLEMADSGEIKDAMTIIALQRAAKAL